MELDLVIESGTTPDNSGVVNQMNLFNYWKIELYSIKNSRFKGIDGERV